MMTNSSGIKRCNSIRLIGLLLQIKTSHSAIKERCANDGKELKGFCFVFFKWAVKCL